MGRYILVSKPTRHNKVYRGNLTKFQRSKRNRETFIFLALSLALILGNVAYTKITEANIRNFTIYPIDATVEASEVIAPTEAIVGTDGEAEAIKTSAYPTVAMLIETPEQEIRRISSELNFKWPDYLVKLAKCESSLNPNAININKNKSIDRGLFQWNDKMPPLGGITDECAFSVDCSTRATINAINLGYQQRWMCNKIIL